MPNDIDDTAHPQVPLHAVPAIRGGVSPVSGRGVFATRRILKGELVERVMVVPIPKSERDLIDKTVIGTYVYEWQGDYAFACGMGSLYNHSFQPTVVYKKHYDRGVIEYHALQDIAEGDEMFVNYNGDPNDKSALWFDAA